MEGKILPAPAVAGILRDNFVEVRLHCDLGSNAKANKALQLELANSLALPIFVIMDPESREVLKIHEGLAFAGDFAEFLASAN
ncbi:MAG TPA: hypothetical protein EYG26_06895 [Planctomycetes bacterium]|nr:hypothetical protein [Planctomycetota bacterium]